MNSATKNILARLKGVRQISGGGFMALCPSHNDSNPSLSITPNNDRVLLHCHAGCDIDSILRAIKLTTRDLANRHSSSSNSYKTYDYVDGNNKLLFQVVRGCPKKFYQRRNVNGKWVYDLHGIKKTIYKLPLVKKAIMANKTIFIVEGEKDADMLLSKGFAATCNPGGAGNWRREYSAELANADVVIIPDNDEPGMSHATDVAEKCAGIAKQIKILRLPGLPHKGDVSDWFAAGHTVAELTDLLRSAPADLKSETEPEQHFHLTDLGNSERFTAKFGSDIKYHADSGKWLLWNGRIWKPDVKGKISRMAREVIRDIYLEIENCQTKSEKDALYSHAKRSESVSRLNAITELAKHSKGITISSAEFDSDIRLLNCANGVIDLNTGSLRESRRDDFITKMVNINYDPNAECPIWNKFLADIFSNNKELIDFIQKAAGYSLTGDTSEQCVFLLYGKGSNGKSTFLTVLTEILGDYQRKILTDMLLNKDMGASGCYIAMLPGVRFVSAVEAKSGERLNESLLKELTGGDRLSARHLYQSPFEFDPLFKIWITTNHLPLIDGQDYAIWRRVRLIPFDVQFADEGAGKYLAKDKHLSDKLRSEYAGILAWMVKGCLKWQAEGLGMAEPVKNATEKYMEEMDILSDFFEDCCDIGEDKTVRASKLYSAYAAWANKRGERHPLSSRSFGMRLAERDIFEKRKDRSGNLWHGLSLKDIFSE